MQAKSKFWVNRVRICAAFAVILVCGAKLTFASDPLPTPSIEATQEPTAWTILFKGQKVMLYSFDPHKFKSYVKELYTLTGDNVLRDAPHDHLHHHGLMYAIKVNGINFWEEISGSGVEKTIQISKPDVGTRNVKGRTLPQVSLSQIVHWVAPQDAFLPDSTAVAFLVEHRTLMLSLDPSVQHVALEWHSRFEVGGKTNTVTLSGATYHGLGIRFRHDLDPLAVHSLAGKRPDLANNRQDLSTAPWAAVSFAAPGHPATIVLAGHPENARGEATFFSMLTPFAYLSATQALDKEQLVYHTGDKFEFRYLVLISPTLESSQSIEEQVNGWKE
jgi:hypothetical protein